MLWSFVRFGWRWADEVAVTATADGLRFHPTVRRRRVPWREIRDVAIRTRSQGFSDVREIVFVLRSGSVRIAGFEEEGAEAFVQRVRESLSLRP